MPLSQHHQVTLLKDILNNHSSDCCGSVSECEQVERLVKSLLTNGNINEQLIPTLNEVYQYGQNGKYTSDLDNHINTHQVQLSEWVNNMNEFS
jgi:hypothetical protein